MKPISVYVAGPITKGDQFANTGNAIRLGQQLHELGYVPYIPHWGAIHHLQYAWTHEEWLTYDFFWLDKCDVLLRMPGDSLGADREVVRAHNQGQRVFYSVQELEEWAKR